LSGGIGVGEAAGEACGAGVIVAKTASESDGVAATMMAVGCGRLAKVLSRKKASVPKMMRLRNSK
jgi:hypothetical protein